MKLTVYSLVFLYFCYLAAIITSAVDLAFRDDSVRQGRAFSVVFKSVFWAIIRRNILLLFLVAPLLLAESFLQQGPTWETPAILLYWGAIFGVLSGTVVAAACAFGAHQVDYKSKLYGLATLGAMFVFVILF